MRYLKIASVSFIVLVLVAYGLFQVTKARNFQVAGELISHVQTDEKIVALTFDDGPSERTAEILETLRELDVPATFYLIGRDMAKSLEDTAEIVAAGHEIGNHTYNHDRMVLVSPRFVRSEIEATDRLIRQAGYTGEITFRPPYGKKFLALPMYLNKHDRKTIMWNVESDADPEVAADANKLVEYVTTNTEPGSIILMHAMYNQPAADAIAGIITGLRERGYRFVTVSELLENN